MNIPRCRFCKFTINSHTSWCRNHPAKLALQQAVFASHPRSDEAYARSKGWVQNYQSLCWYIGDGLSFGNMFHYNAEGRYVRSGIWKATYCSYQWNELRNTEFSSLRAAVDGYEALKARLDAQHAADCAREERRDPDSDR